MRVAVFNTHRFDREFFEEANADHRHELHFIEARLTTATSALADGFPAVCAFVNDRLDATVLDALNRGGAKAAENLASVREFSTLECRHPVLRAVVSETKQRIRPAGFVPIHLLQRMRLVRTAS